MHVTKSFINLYNTRIALLQFDELKKKSKDDNVLVTLLLSGDMRGNCILLCNHFLCSWRRRRRNVNQLTRSSQIFRGNMRSSRKVSTSH